MTRTVQRRGQTPKRPPPRRATRPVPKPVPLRIAPRRLFRLVAGGFVGLGIAATAVAATVLGYPQRWWQETAVAAADAGFEVRHVEISGLNHLGRLPVYAAALDGATNSMLLVDLAGARRRLLALPWIADASVARRLPDTLIVDIVERRPAALWQVRQHFAVIDRSGRALATEQLERFGKLPVVVGPGANVHAAEILARLETQPRLAARVAAATLVGGRRWDLKLASGEVIALPEGGAATTRALAQFAALDQAKGLIARGFTRFDLRVPDRMTVRGPGIRAALDAQPKLQKPVEI